MSLDHDFGPYAPDDAYLEGAVSGQSRRPRWTATSDEPETVPEDELRLAHPLETLARRPARHPVRWKPEARTRSEHLLPRSFREGWHSPCVETDPAGGAVTIDFKYCHVGGATASYSDKARRQQFMSGPHETSYWRLLETSAYVEEFLFHPFTIVWTTRDDEKRGYTPDVLEIRADGSVAVVEVKADPAYFQDPDTDDVLARAEAFLATKGVGFERRCGLQNELERTTAKAVADRRRIDFSHQDETAVRTALREGPATVGDLLEAISGFPEAKAAKLRSMAARGVVAIDTGRPWMPWTPATPAPPRAAGRSTIRGFLAFLAANGEEGPAS